MSAMDYYERPVSRARGRLIASRQAFFEQVASPQPSRGGGGGGGDAGKNITHLVDEKLERFTRSTQEATKSLAKSTPDLTALEADANIRVSQHLSKSRGNLNQTFDSSLINVQRNGVFAEVDGSGPVSANKSFSSYFTHKKPPLPPKKPSSPPPPVPIGFRDKENREPATVAIPARAPVAAVKMSEFDRIVNSIKSTDTYRRYKNHPSLVQPPDMRRRSKSLGFLELDEDDNWVLPKPTKPITESVLPELSERSVSTTHLAKKSGASGSSDGASGATDDDDDDDDDDVPIPCNRLAAAKSEYELRVEKSLKNLTLPEWYTRSSRPSSRASILSGRGTPAMSSERFIRHRPDYESFRSVHSAASGGAPRRDNAPTRTTTPSWRSFTSARRSSPPTPGSEAEHERMEKTQNWINSQRSTGFAGHESERHLAGYGQRSSNGVPREPPYAGWRRAREFEPRTFDSRAFESRAFESRAFEPRAGSDVEYSSSFEEQRYGSERYSFVQAVNNSALSDDQRSYLETSFDSGALPTTETYHNKVWIESSLISRPVDGGFQKGDLHDAAYRQESFPNGYTDAFGVFEKRGQRHPDVIYNGKEAPPRPSSRHPFTGGLLEAVV
ncbi:hypothetical protein BIW11_01334 [Tropilaelaps mercedesae]|uniref:Uncharacterized protein n=1 Tax=Tropilaelaps mercedesae TaxID=418985 RepID=A0A1V9XFZ2_9ACAR|nr:hypothetical protein BIW11_01334 [Tropilaelaps mercedesae]